MTKKNNPHLWKEGSSGNPNGRPKAKGKPVSSLRKTISKLRELEEQALENIASVVKGTKVKVEGGEETVVDKSMLETSKWVISTLSSMSSAATKDEELRYTIRSRAEDKAEREQEKATGTNDASPKDNVIRNRFTTKLIKDDTEDDTESVSDDFLEDDEE